MRPVTSVAQAPLIRLASADQERWRSFSRSLADYHYDQAEEDQTARQRESFLLAADYYSQLADRTSAEGDVLRLAGDAFLQAGDHVNAFEHYQRAAYDTDYEIKEDPAAADAAWAAIVIQRDALDNRNLLPATLDDLAAAADRFAAKFPEDQRQPGLMADISNRMLAQHRYADALRFSDFAITHPSVSAAERYSAWVAAGEANVAMASYGLAENAWRQSLALISEGLLQDALANPIAANPTPASAVSPIFRFIGMSSMLVPAFSGDHSFPPPSPMRRNEAK